MTSASPTRSLMSAAALATLGLALAPPAPAQTTLAELEYRDGHREAAMVRRAEVMRRMEGGLAVITSADRSQPNLYEFYTPDTEQHDFLFLTGIYEAAPPGSVLVLNPGGGTYREILYTDLDPAEARSLSGLEHVFPRERFLEDLSSALTDFRNLRITQLRFKAVPSDLARGWGDRDKILYVNYPRVTNLNEPAQPRLAFVDRLRAATSEMDVRDAGDLLDRQRMILDDFALKNVRRAVEITGKGIAEGMKAARPGLTTRQVMETVDYVYRLHGADLGFDTHVGVASGLDETIEYATAREEAAARGGDARITDGILVHFDTGARINHYSADVQRTVPAGDRFTEEQRRVYEVVLGVQKAVIAAVRPGVTWQELHDLAVRMLKDAGGWDESYTYGIGHYIGLEVHEHGDYVEPLVPGMALAIEQGAIVDGTRVALEDDVLVTADGHEWLTRSIPIEIADVEALRRQAPLVRPEELLKKR
ncbi:MAG TPA: M24 family metallopeptidase [Longimicrobiales bacterium]|nr:M24 family metallopeptidase [Longimicrobiales bacterium]